MRHDDHSCSAGITLPSLNPASTGEQAEQSTSAVRGGASLALGCDLLVASRRAVFADTHVRVGVLPGGGMTARLSRAVGSARARRMSPPGEVIDAHLPLRIGLVTEVVEHSDLIPLVQQLASAIA